MFDVRSIMGLLTALLAGAVIAVVALFFFGGARPMVVIEELFMTPIPQPFTIKVHLPGCVPSGSSNAISKSGFYSGEGKISDTSGSCPSPPAATGLRTIPAGDFSSALCLGTCTPAASAETYAQAAEILAWSQRFNLALSKDPTSLGIMQDEKVTITVELPPQAGLVKATGVTCADPSALGGCKTAFTKSVELCFATDKSANCTDPTVGYTTAAGWVALSR